MGVRAASGVESRDTPPVSTASAPPPAPVDVTGHCYCGQTRFRVRIPAGEKPVFTAYCHCDSCRRAHAAPLYHVAAVTTDMFEITEGAENIVDFQRPGGPVRTFCRRCGTRMTNRFPNWRDDVVAFFPNTLDEATTHALPQLLRPRRNSHRDECVLDVEHLRWLFEDADAS
jgi:hypothetical protein